MLARFKGLVTPPVIISAVLVIAVASVGVAYMMTNRRPTGSFVQPTMGSLVEEVDTTGSVQAADEIDLGFQVSGSVANAGPSVGTHVHAGQALGSLSSADLQAAVEQAQAALQVQQANLASLQSGATPQTVAVSQTAVSNAQASLTQAQQTVIQAAQDAYAKSDDAIHNKVDAFFTTPRSATPSLVFTLANSEDQSQMVAGRVQMEQLLTSWQQYLASLPADPTQVDTAALASTTRANLEQVGAYLNLVATGLTEVVPNSSYPTATIQTYQSNVSTGRTNVSADIGSINTAQIAVTTDESALASAHSQLSLTQAPPTQTSLEAQQAQVAVAQAALDAARAQLGKSVISAPIAGTVTVNNLEPGQVVTPGATQVSMISDTAFQFQTYVSEADLAKLKVGDTAAVELDAYQDQAPLSAHVIQIDPAATVQSGVSSYKVTLQFDENDPRISSGETGSGKITTRSLTDVMSVPTSAIINNNGNYFVTVETSNGLHQVPVQVGIVSATGYTEIVSGLSATDEVQTFGSAQ